MSSQPYGIKLPPIEGISAEVFMGTTPTIDELRQHEGMMPILIEAGMPEPIVAVRLMVGVRAGEGSLLTVGFLGNIDLSDTEEVEAGMDNLLLQSPGDGPAIERDIYYDTRLQVIPSATSIIIASDTYIDPSDTKLPKKPLSAFTSTVFANAFRIIRNYDRLTTGKADPKSIKDLGRFLIVAA